MLLKPDIYDAKKHNATPSHPSLKEIYHTPSRTLSQLEKYNFSGERKNHWLR
jgi:hypothetical protein